MASDTSLILIRNQDNVYVTGTQMEPCAILLAGSKIVGLLDMEQVKVQAFRLCSEVSLMIFTIA